MKRVKTHSGIMGFQCKLQDSYKDFEEFELYSLTYELATKLNTTEQELWDANPIIQGSVNPSDFCIIGDFQVLSPDGFTIERDVVYKNSIEVNEAIERFVERYKQQGYYSTIVDQERVKISIEELHKHCLIINV